MKQIKFPILLSEAIMDNQDIKGAHNPCTQEIEGVLCDGIDCKVWFHSKKKNQAFCSEDCRKIFYRVARKLGANFLRGLKVELSGRKPIS